MRALAAAAGLSLFLAACSGGGPPSAPPPGLQEARAERDVADGVPKLTSTITVRFDRDFKLAAGRVPLASFFELSLAGLDGNLNPERVFVAKATRSDQNPRLVTLNVDRLVPDGSELRVAKRAFQSSATGDITVTVKSDLPAVFAVLASKAFAPTRPQVLAESTPPVRPEDRDPAAMRAALEAHLTTRKASAETRTQALGRYDGMPADVVPSPKLRAALAALTGTFAQPAIDYLLTANNCTSRPALLIAFQPPPDAPELFARATISRGRRVISVAPAGEGERIEHLMPILAHEAIHCDQLDGRFEEVAATAFDAYLYIQLVVVDPTLATAGTRLARELNIDAIALINSGRALPESIGVLRSPGVNRVLPGSTSPAPSFADLVAAAYSSIDYNDSPAEPLAQLYVETLANIARIKPDNAFRLPYLDELLGRTIDPRVLVAAISALGLAPPG